MANELANATTLMKDTDFRDWVRAASVYVAREVISDPTPPGDQAVRLAFAKQIALNPDLHLNQLVNVIACDPEVAAKGNNVTAVTQATVIAKVQEVWSPLAALQPS